MRLFRSVALLGVAALLVAGCGNLAERATEEVVERAAEQAGDGDVEIDVGESDFDVKVENSEGSFEVGSNAELPDAFPADFPLPDEYRVVNAMASKEGGEETVHVTLMTPASGSDITAFYAEALSQGGYELVRESNTDAGDGNTASNLVFEGDDFDGAVTVYSSGDETSIGITLGSPADN